MHTPSGEIHNNVDIEIFRESAERNLELAEGLINQQRLVNREEKIVSLTQSEAEMLMPLHKKQRKGWMRNQPCVCGSGKKFKKCCWNEFK